jgi:hypothetical protein
MVLLHAAFLLLALHADAGTDSGDFRRLSEHVRVLGVTLNQDTFSPWLIPYEVPVPLVNHGLQRQPSALRIHHGPGYRVYFVQRGLEVVVLLGGGDKSSQTRDIASALELARRL